MKIANFDSLSQKEKINLIFQYASIIVATIGTVANMLAYVVFSRRRFVNYSFAFYSKVRVCVDIGVLLHSFRHFAAFVLDINIDLKARLICQLTEYSAYIFGSMSVWLLALIAFDRLITIVFPNRLAFLKKRCAQTAFVLALTVYSSLMYLPMPLNTVLRRPSLPESTKSNLTKTTAKSPGESEYHCSIEDVATSKLVYWIDLVNLMTVTFGLNNILTAVIIIYIYRSRKKFKAFKENREKRATKKDRKFAINSIVLNVKCLVCKMPLLVIMLVNSYSTLSSDTVEMLFTIGVTIFTIDNSSAFFINLMVNSIFYDEFLTMIGLRETKRRSVSYVSMNTTTLTKTQV
jgi:hypothetical protein